MKKNLKLLVALIAATSGLILTSKTQANAQTIKVSRGAELYNKKENIISNYSGQKKDNYSRYSSFDKATTLNYYSSKLVTGKKIVLHDFNTPVYIKNEEYYSLGDGGYIKSVNAGSSGKKVYYLSRNSYIYDKNGKRIKKYRGKTGSFKKGTKLTYNGKVPYYYKPTEYFYIGNGAYASGDNIVLLNGKGVMKLGTNSYLYTSKGNKTQTKLYKGSLVNYAGKVSKADGNSPYYYIFYGKNDSTKKTPKTYKIKGKNYYKLRNGYYIRAVNVDTINGHKLISNSPVTGTLLHDQYSDDKYLNTTNHLYKAGSKVKIDYMASYSDSDGYEKYAHIKGTDEYLHYCYVDEDDDKDISAKHNVNTVRYYELFTSEIDPNSEIQVYDVNGQPTNKTIKKYDATHVDGLFYLYNPADKKVEPYYHIQDQYLIGRWYYAEYYNEEIGFEPEKEYNGFVKASDVDKVYGKKIKYQNTEKQAKVASEKASESDLKALASKVNKAEDKKNTDLYRLTDYVGRYYYDYAIKYAKQISEGKGSAQLEDRSSAASQTGSASSSSSAQSSPSSASSSSSSFSNSSSSQSSSSSSTKSQENSNEPTKAEVDLATWLLKDSASYLNGKKVKVLDTNNLTGVEAEWIHSLMSDVYDSVSDRDPRSFVQMRSKYAHQSGTYPGGWINNKMSSFVLYQAKAANDYSYIKTTLKISDFATDK